MIIERKWAMPSKNTFSIKPIKELLEKELKGCKVIIDPFANESKIGTITNDLNPEFDTDYHMDALDFFKMMKSESADCVLYDPPYSVREVSECYKGFGKEVTQETTRADWWTKHRTEIGRIVKKGGKAISFGWNSGGIGKKNGFEIERILLVAHGGVHNDTIVVVEKKV